jgi:hypothetical protein
MIKEFYKSIMTNREQFIFEVEQTIKDCPDFFSLEALEYFNELKNGVASRGGLTEAGEKVLLFMLENEKAYSNVFSAKVIGEGLFVHPRSVCGTMRKLITDGYVTKMGQNPVSYSLTDTARSCL